MIFKKLYTRGFYAANILYIPLKIQKNEDEGEEEISQTLLVTHS